MKAQRSGRVVHISSTAADAVGTIAAHSVAKAALNTRSRHIAADVGLAGVSVNTVATGQVIRVDGGLDVLSRRLAGLGGDLLHSGGA
ncbi:SDR family NAD(P)-dependent oxidoreductase [Umezawaea sp. Da 62-37]|uniref:SDR family NAD(P)-dependent oxidoreductase n=1 Tax=Umezawaea sp. Da 62-37 TaxID=3075927 RepID=UPI0028F6DA97|nr:SDR family NAD(P)-dependent oxidoreductase [Umezawaea sp. Da 62-37]WNV86875.1 SDR family NAD(P)-dependent oxidoreductase [Umezawaea sp. Da 62-37]